MATPSDIILSRYSDVNPRYSIKNGEILEVGLEAINGSIENILGTSFGERVFLPEFGSGVKSLLFENINEDTADRIMNALTDAIQKWEPRIEIQQDETYILPKIDENLYEINITYRLVDIDIVSQFHANISNF